MCERDRERGRCERRECVRETEIEGVCERDRETGRMREECVRETERQGG